MGVHCTEMGEEKKTKYRQKAWERLTGEGGRNWAKQRYSFMYFNKFRIVDHHRTCPLELILMFKDWRRCRVKFAGIYVLCARITINYFLTSGCGLSHLFISNIHVLLEDASQ